MHKVVISIWPTKELTVSDAEYEGFKALGLVIDTPESTPENKVSEPETEPEEDNEAAGLGDQKETSKW